MQRSGAKIVPTDEGLPSRSPRRHEPFMPEMGYGCRFVTMTVRPLLEMPTCDDRIMWDIYLSANILPAVAACVGMGFGARTLVRRLPVNGRLVRAGVAYAGTRVLGEARLRL